MHIKRTFCKLFYVMCATGQIGHIGPLRALICSIGLTLSVYLPIEAQGLVEAILTEVVVLKSGCVIAIPAQLADGG